jgi:dihydroflavonol-4-reductase
VGDCEVWSIVQIGKIIMTKREGQILVTGAAGFIGSHLVDLLLEKGIKPEKLTLLIPDGESLTNLPQQNFSIVRGDIRDVDAVRKAMENVTMVYHLAARIDFEGKTYKEYEDVNVIGTQNLLDECRGKIITKFILYSSIGVFGLPAGIGPIEGWDETHPKTYTNFYGRSKWEAELRVVQAHKEFGLPYAIIRPASVYGPREKGPTLGLYRAIKQKQFAMIGDGKNMMHYVYVTDLVEATYLAAMQDRPTGDYIVAGPEPTPFNEVVRCIAESVHSPIPTLRLPKFFALFIGTVLEILGNILGFTPPLFPSRVRTMTTTYYYTIAKAKRELGYRPKVDFCEGARLTGHWYLQHKYLS